MSYILVLAEKPEVAADIAGAILPGCENHKSYFTGVYHGNTWTVTSAFGHLLDLADPKEYNEEYAHWRIKDLPLYFPDWKTVPAAEKYKSERLKLIQGFLAQADSVVCAGDPDDEGQLLIDELLDFFHYSGNTYRVFINDNMVSNIQKEFRSLKLNDDYRPLSRAAAARRMADICFGINESRLAGIRLKKQGLSVGRVQTPTLGLVVARDESIENHIKELYYEMYADVAVASKTPRFQFKADKVCLKNKETELILDRNWLEEIGSRYDGKTETVKVTEKKKTTSPPLPYNLTTLQADMNKRFGYTSAKTLSITQSLRSKKAITYNRSDSRYLKEEHYQQAPDLFRTILNGSLVNKYKLNFRIHSACFNDKNVTAHHGIIPQCVNIDLKTLTAQERNVYLAICDQYAKQFMPPLKQTVSHAVIPLQDGSYTHSYEHSCARTIDPGYTAFFGRSTEEEEDEKGIYLPEGVYDGLILNHTIEEKETKPPARYTEGTLIRDMASIAKYVEDPEIRAILKRKDEGKKGENGSIGTVATRSAIIENLIKKGFLKRDKKYVISTDLGRNFYHILPPEISKADTTAKWWLIQEAIKDGTETDVNAIQRSVVEEFEKRKDTAYKDVKLQLYTPKEKYDGVWNGETVSFSKTWGGHTFTEEEAQALLEGQTISFRLKGREISGKLARQIYKKREFVGFQMDQKEKSEADGYVKGNWKGKEVAFKRTWSGHSFTDEEVARLLAGETITINAKSKAGKDYTVSGCLANQTYKGAKFVGFKPEFQKRK